MSDFAIRHYDPEKDLVLLSKMLTEIETIDRDGEETSEAYLRGMLEWKNFRPTQDAWIAEIDGRFIGYAAAIEQPSHRCTLYAVVHPSQRRMRLGSQLLELTITRARENQLHNLMIYANEYNEASNLFLKRHQFQRVGSSGAMQAPADVLAPPPEFPIGFTLKRYSEINEPRILLHALNYCYLDMWGHQHNEHPSQEDLQSPPFLKYYDAGDILLLFDEKDALMGICSVKSGGKQNGDGSYTDVIDAPGIIKEYREQGYQQPFVLAAIQHLRKKEARSIALEFWGDSEQVLNIYRSLGFEMVNHYLAYHKELK